MNKQFIKDTFGGGITLGLVSYILGIILFVIFSPAIMGWIIMPMGIAMALWVLFKKIKSNLFVHYLYVGIIGTLIAVALDYLLLVKVFEPAGGYYTPGAYLYYILSFILPIIVGFKKSLKK